MNNQTSSFSTVTSTLIFGGASILLFFETRVVIPYFSKITGQEPIIFWFLVVGIGCFLPLILCGIYLLKKEGYFLSGKNVKERINFRPLTKKDLQWVIGGFFSIAFLSFIIMQLLEQVRIQPDHQPVFMQFEPLDEGRYWILLLWLPFWILNILGEEFLWRGVLFKYQQAFFGKYTWIFHGTCWGLFHLAFGWQLLLTLLPILFILPLVYQKTNNIWSGVIIHAGLNGPSFIAISFGLI